MIEVKNLKKQFGELSVLKGITEHISQGEKIAVIGPSGSGKSTFLRCLNLLEIPTEGEIWFDGVNMTDVNVDIDRMRQKMGMVFQHFNLSDCSGKYYSGSCSFEAADQKRSGGECKTSAGSNRSS